MLFEAVQAHLEDFSLPLRKKLSTPLVRDAMRGLSLERNPTVAPFRTSLISPPPVVLLAEGVNDAEVRHRR